MATFFVTVGLLGLMLFSLKRNLQDAWWYVIVICSLIYIYSYIRVGLSNPGFEPPIANPDQSVL